MKRATTTRQIAVHARCRNCPWRANTANAQAIAARHNDAHQHQTVVTTTTEVVYGDGTSIPGGSAQTAIPIPGVPS